MTLTIVSDAERLELAPETPEERKLFKEAVATVDFARLTLKLAWEDDSHTVRLVYTDASHLYAIGELFKRLANRMHELQEQRHLDALTETPETPPGA